MHLRTGRHPRYLPRQMSVAETLLSPLIWLGALVMMAGGTLSLADRRLRVGAPKPARRAAPAVAAD